MFALALKLLLTELVLSQNLRELSSLSRPSPRASTGSASAACWCCGPRRPARRYTLVENALASNAPHIRLLQELNMRFLLGVKPDDHEHLFKPVADAPPRPAKHKD